MPSSFHHAVLIGRPDTTGMATLLMTVAEFLSGLGLDVSIEAETSRHTGLTDWPVVEATDIGSRCDLAVVIGGDGTMLRFARLLAQHGTPLVGINRGRLGFVTDIAIGAMREALTAIAAGDFVSDRRPLLEGSVWRDGALLLAQPALNDIVVSRGATSGMIELTLHLGSEFVARFRADGLIVASPTGSTAYALSVGGPILHPAIGAWVVAPIAPHELINRPIVLPDTQEARIEFVTGRQASATFDGRSPCLLLPGDRVCIRRSAACALFLHPSGWRYYGSLRAKLHWNVGAVPSPRPPQDDGV